MGSVLVGITFSLGWTPCVGPALSSVLIMASTSESLLQGHLPSQPLFPSASPSRLFASALVFDRLFALLKRYGHVVKYAMRILGALLILIGLLLVTNYYSFITELLGSLMGR